MTSHVSEFEQVVEILNQRTGPNGTVEIDFSDSDAAEREVIVVHVIGEQFDNMLITFDQLEGRTAAVVQAFNDDGVRIKPDVTVVEPL